MSTLQASIPSLPMLPHPTWKLSRADPSRPRLDKVVASRKKGTTRFNAPKQKLREMLAKKPSMSLTRTNYPKSEGSWTRHGACEKCGFCAKHEIRSNMEGARLGMQIGQGSTRPNNSILQGGVNKEIGPSNQGQRCRASRSSRATENRHF